MAPHVHLIESTLTGESGHCFSFVNSVCRAWGDAPLTLWVGRLAPSIQFTAGVEVKRHFFRRVRRLQSLFLYCRLLHSGDKSRIFIATAGRTDLMLLDWAGAGQILPDQVYLYFHWLRLNPKKQEQLRRIATRQPNLRTFGPTATVVADLRECGFKSAELIPYPISPVGRNGVFQPSDFSGILFAGAARQDKGFDRVVDLVEYLSQNNAKIPVKLQRAADHYERYDLVIKAQLDRLAQSTYPLLAIKSGTLLAADYAALFTGAICLQPYNQNDFADRISGVTLDALSAGCPVIVPADTWMARVVERFAAGKVIADFSPAVVLEAAAAILAEFAQFQQNAFAAGQTLQAENSAAHLYRALTA